MTRIYSIKLAMLVVVVFLHTTLLATTHWVNTFPSANKTPQFLFTGSTQSGGTVEVIVPGFQLEEKVIGNELVSIPTIENGHPMLIKGNPDLQKINFVLELPAHGNLIISIANSEYIDYTNINIPASMGNVYRNEASSFVTKSDQFLKNEFYPGKIFDQDYPYIVRNTRAQAIQLYPLQYNAVTKTLRVYSRIVLEFENNGEQGDNELSVSDLHITPLKALSAISLNPAKGNLKAGALPDVRGRMLIICPSQFAEAIQPLANWRNQTGIRTEIVNAGQFPTPDELHAFIKEKYYAYGDLSYLLLVGDAEQIPPYMLPYGASDNYYSYLAGNDHYPDILVGRFSSETIEEVKIQVNRTIEYEKNPQNGESWIPNATGIASSLSCGDDLESDAQHIRNLLSELTKGTYTSVNEFFEGSNGGADADGNPTTEMVASKIKTGTGVIFYSGHGSPNSWATGSITKGVVDYMDNFSKYPLIWSVACETGNFKGQRCLAEAWLRAGTGNKPAGAVAALMASGTQTTFPPMQAQDKIAEILGNNTEEILTMGSVTVAGLMSMNDAYGSVGYSMTDIWVLFGDPALLIRTSAPKTLHAIMDDNIGEGRLYYTVNSTASDGLVCMSQNNQVMGTASLEKGNSNIVLDYPASGDKYDLTLTALNYIPIQKSIQVSVLPGNPECTSPLNHSKLQPITSILNWNTSEGAASDYYLIKFGTDNPPTNILQGEKTIDNKLTLPLLLEYATTYFWQIVSVNKNGSGTSPVYQFTTVFKPDEDFEPEFKHKLAWGHDGNSEWKLDTLYRFDGQKALRSGAISDNQYSSIIFPCVVSGCEFVSFWSKTSSGANDKLQFFVDNELLGEWSGENDWQYHIFTIQNGNRRLEWRYQKGSTGHSAHDAVWIDDIHLPVHDAMAANSQQTAQVCENALYTTEGTADNYFNITWTSDGDGEFIENGLTNSIYKPGIADILKGNTLLTMNVNGAPGCETITKSTLITFNPSPVINLPEDTLINTNTINLNAGTNTGDTYLWQPSNSYNPCITVDSSMAINGIATIQLIATSDKGCQKEKELRIHFNNTSIENQFSIFPNPSNGNFKIIPEKGCAALDNMQIFDNTGKCVWQQNLPQNIIESTELSIYGLKPGIYQFVTRSESGLTNNSIVIQ